MSTESSVVVAERYAHGAMVAAVVVVTCWHLGYDLTSTVSSWSVYSGRWLAALAWVLFLAIGVAATWLLRDRSHRFAWPLAVCALALDVLLVAAAPDENLLRPANWAWGAVGWLAVVLFWWHPVRHLVAFSVANAVVLAVSMVTFDVTGSEHVSRAIMVVFGAVTLQIGYSVGAHGLGTAAGWAAASSAARAKATAERAAAEAVAASRAQRYQELHRTTAALLGELAAGADPADPAVRYRCLAGAARLRRLLAETDDVPDPLLHELRAGADVAERRGVVVTLSVVGTVPELPVEFRRALTEAPIMALSTARTTARVTVVSADGEVAIAVVADAPEVAARPRPGVRLTQDREGENLWLETVWRTQ
ncbi:hypothetical protein V5P93_006274 [Actinokineospora auranticolor]|uniref:Signal transduction histidine kinase n=1 Tax=Actinokineospora auranticolor TaxID=155976 RepID=A0A2S6GI83_9PSEU|nr:hypothetical protein [Actinokineospora auranticolor]PPK64871.1 hypothetical protein CLV40_117110 [Actinokineospora auranticolor]